MNRLIQMEVLQDDGSMAASPLGPPCPEFCEAGPTTHTWKFQWSTMDGASIETADCVICNRTANSSLSDWPHEYLTIGPIDVRLETHTEVYGYESPEYDYWVDMIVQPERNPE